jgi:pimeloyl-ACP methyl ester carboxylesterase
MTPKPKLGLLFLHALPLDGSMWGGQRNLLPNSTYMPTLYALGDSIEAWASAAWKHVKEERLIVVGCSVGGSCALEIAAVHPERVAALVLIGTKANHRPDPQLHAAALEMIEECGLEAAWRAFWAPLFSRSASASVLGAAREIFLRQSARDIEKGVTVFHTRPSRGQTLSTFSGPVTIVSGAEDIAPGLKMSAAQASSAREGALITIPDCGHYVPLEKPARLNEILRDVIAAHTPTS